MYIVEFLPQAASNIRGWGGGEAGRNSSRRGKWRYRPGYIACRDLWRLLLLRTAAAVAATVVGDDADDDDDDDDNDNYDDNDDGDGDGDDDDDDCDGDSDDIP